MFRVTGAFHLAGSIDQINLLRKPTNVLTVECPPPNVLLLTAGTLQSHKEVKGLLIPGDHVYNIL
jgi:hypothetical protein